MVLWFAYLGLWQRAPRKPCKQTTLSEQRTALTERASLRGGSALPRSRGRSRTPLREGSGTAAARDPHAAANQRGAAAAASLWGRSEPISAADAVWRKRRSAVPWPPARRARWRGRWRPWVRAGGPGLRERGARAAGAAFRYVWVKINCVQWR